MQPEISPFGRTLRFWRQTLEVSQENLSFDLDISRKHLSNLETGRSSPSLELTIKIAKVLNLQQRDINNLLVAAGFAPDALIAPPEDSDEVWRKKAITIMLRGLDPKPCIVRDRYGYIIAVNRGWVDYSYRWLGDFIFESPLNMYRLTFHERGWSQFARDWGEVVRQGMAGLRQELLLAPNEQAESLYQEMLAYPSIRQQLKGGEPNVPTMNVYNFCLQKGDEPLQTSTVVITTFTEETIIEPRLLIDTWFPRDFTLPKTEDELQADRSLSHPLLYY